MVRLISRQHQIPGGLKFYQPETKGKPRDWASFGEIVSWLISHRRANPFLMEKHGWSIDQVSVENEVDFFNARLCEQMGWTDYYTSDGGAPPNLPFNFPEQDNNQQQAVPLKGKLSQLVAGAPTLVKWIANGAEAVPQDVANLRASICARCPYNGKGDWTSYFTIPVVNAIRSELEKRKGMNLSTPYDLQLGVCESCSCVLTLKVHVPLKSILADMPSEIKESLHPTCWVLDEERESLS